MKPIKIIRIINRFNLGGPTYNVAYLSKYMSDDFETLLVGGAKDESEESSDFIVKNLGIEPIIIPQMRRSINPFNDISAYIEIKKLIKQHKPDIVHTHASKAGTLGRLAAFSCGVPVVVHTFHGHVFHSYFGKFKTAVYKTIERYLAKRSTAIIAISEKQKHELGVIHKICSPEKITVVPLGFDLQKFQDNQIEKRKSFRSQYQISDNEIAITIIGRLVPIKNHELFLKAIAYLQKNSSKKIRAFIVGDGESRSEIESKATELGIDFCNALTDRDKISTLTFTSWRKDVDVVCAGSDIICLTSHNEGTPVSLIEAQAANKPIVSTNVGGIENVVSNQTTLLSEAGDTEKFCSNLLLLVNDDILREKMGQKGWELMKENFHYTRLVKDVKKLYDNLLNIK